MKVNYELEALGNFHKAKPILKNKNVKKIEDDWNLKITIGIW